MVCLLLAHDVRMTAAQSDSHVRAGSCAQAFFLISTPNWTARSLALHNPLYTSWSAVQVDTSLAGAVRTPLRCTRLAHLPEASLATGSRKHQPGTASGSSESPPSLHLASPILRWSERQRTVHAWVQAAGQYHDDNDAVQRPGAAGGLQNKPSSPTAAVCRAQHGVHAGAQQQRPQWRAGTIAMNADAMRHMPGICCRSSSFGRSSPVNLGARQRQLH